MCLAHLALAEAGIAQAAESGAGGKKVPPKRISVALSDRKLAPEPR